MNDSVRGKDALVNRQEVSRSEAFINLFHLRVGKSNPYFTHFIFIKKMVDNIYPGTDKSTVIKTLLISDCGAGPHSGTFNIYTDKIFFGESASQFHGIFTLTASQFKNYRIIISKKFLTPASFQQKAGSILHYIVIRELEYIRQLLHIGKLLQFIFSHNNYSVIP